MHAEAFEISEETADRIERARAAKRPIVAIGTTVVRALEAAALQALESTRSSLVQAGRAEARSVYLSRLCISRYRRAADEFSSAALDVAGACLRVRGQRKRYRGLSARCGGEISVL